MTNSQIEQQSEKETLTEEVVVYRHFLVFLYIVFVPSIIFRIFLLPFGTDDPEELTVFVQTLLFVAVIGGSYVLWRQVRTLFQKKVRIARAHNVTTDNVSQVRNPVDVASQVKPKRGPTEGAAIAMFVVVYAAPVLPLAFMLLGEYDSLLLQKVIEMCASLYVVSGVAGFFGIPHSMRHNNKLLLRVFWLAPLAVILFGFFAAALLS